MANNFECIKAHTHRTRFGKAARFNFLRYFEAPEHFDLSILHIFQILLLKTVLLVLKTEKSRRFSEQRPVCVCLYHNKTWPSTIDNSRYVRRLILPYLPRHNCFASKIVAKKPSCICAIFADYTRARIIVVINDYIE